MIDENVTLVKEKVLLADGDTAARMSEWVYSRRLYHFRCGLHFVVADEGNALTLAQWKCAGEVLDSTLTLRKCSGDGLDNTLTLRKCSSKGLDSTLTLQKCSGEGLDSTLTP